MRTRDHEICARGGETSGIRRRIANREEGKSRQSAKLLRVGCEGLAWDVRGRVPTAEISLAYHAGTDDALGFRCLPLDGVPSVISQNQRWQTLSTGSHPSFIAFLSK